MPVHFLVVPHGGGVEKTKPAAGHLTHHGQRGGAGLDFAKTNPTDGLLTDRGNYG
jgi:hypothetical protein